MEEHKNERTKTGENRNGSIEAWKGYPYGYVVK